MWQTEVFATCSQRGIASSNLLGSGGNWGVGLFLEQGVGAHSQSGGRRRSHGHDVIALASDWGTHK